MIEAVIEALRRVSHPRFFETERGFQGEFQKNLSSAIPSLQLDGAIVEEEYQKRMREHGIKFRPDIIVHIPTQEGGNRREGNFAVFALKLNANPAKARDDFGALDELFDMLDYPFGAFINIASRRTYASMYGGRYRDRMHFLAVWQDDGNTRVEHQHYRGEELIGEQ